MGRTRRHASKKFNRSQTKSNEHECPDRKTHVTRTVRVGGWWMVAGEEGEKGKEREKEEREME